MRNKRRKSNAIIIIGAAFGLICMLGFTGVSYAAWNDNVKLDSNISSGKLDADIEDESIDGESSGIKVGDTTTMQVAIKNNGSIPIKVSRANLMNQLSYKNDKGAVGLEVNVSVPPDNILPGEEKTIQLQLTGKAPGEYSIDIAIPFIQFNRETEGNGGWSQNLKLSQSVKVLEPEKKK